MKSLIDEVGFVGNVWVRQHWLLKAGDTVGGHAHYHDHVTLLVKGSADVSVNDGPSKRFIAPTFIGIKKEHRHSFVAVEDDTVFYCVFAMRDLEGNVVDICDEPNMPLYSQESPPFYTLTLPITDDRVVVDG
jgi:hypothetical protein